jgi:hypothetical protein
MFGILPRGVVQNCLQVGRNSLSAVSQARTAIATGMKLVLDFKEPARTISAA